MWLRKRETVVGEKRRRMTRKYTDNPCCLGKIQRRPYAFIKWRIYLKKGTVSMA